MAHYTNVKFIALIIIATLKSIESDKCNNPSVVKARIPSGSFLSYRSNFSDKIKNTLKGRHIVYILL